MNKTFKNGDNVTYFPKHGDPQRGIVKEARDDIAFVVYHCNGEWNRYENYTGQATNISDLKHGWGDENPIYNTLES